MNGEWFKNNKANLNIYNDISNEDYNEGKPVEFRHFSIIQCPRWERIYHVFKGED